MSLTRQIEDARQALEDLMADERELSRLEAEQAAEIARLKEGGSKDFAALATLEGKRAALASMLTEQRGHISQARAQLAALEADRVREGHLDTIQAKAAEIRQARGRLYTGLSELTQTLAAELERLIELRLQWGQLRSDCVTEARALGVGLSAYRVHDDPLAKELYETLLARGADVEALLLNLGFSPPFHDEKSDSLPIGGEHHVYAAFPERVGALVETLFWGALEQHRGANSEEALASREQAAGVRA